MTLTIKIDMDNEAFAESNGQEVSRILVEFAGRGWDFVIHDSGRLRDINGNSCGLWQVGKT
jgi:hypothetical protein